MKKIFLLLFIFSFLGNSKAQITTPFPDTSASWTSQFQILSNNQILHNRFLVSGDTTIGSNKYFFLSQANNIIDTVFSHTPNYRIDSMKVFLWLNDTTDFLLYDFGLNLGDTFYLFHEEVVAELISIDTVTIYSGQSLKRYFFDNSTIWYYGIGRGYGYQPCCLEGYFSLTSFYYKGECYIFDPNYDSLLCTSANLLNVEENKEEESFSIYPNPSNGNFSIETENNVGSSIEILDLNGKIAYTSIVSSNRQEIELNVENGIYILALQTSNGVFRKKMIIAN